MKTTQLLTVLVSAALVISLLTGIGVASLHTKINNLGAAPAAQGQAQVAAPTAAAPTPAAPAPSPKVEMDIDDDDVKGDKDAKVTIIEFSDFECPFCARFYSETLPQVEQNFIDTGRANLVYRDFPLSFHPNAQKAGEAAECAGEQGKFWEMHDKLFESGVGGGAAQYKGFAAEIGLDQAAFDSCLDNGDQASEVQNDFQEGAAIGVSGTPSFIINGVQFSGACPYQTFEQAIQLAEQGADFSVSRCQVVPA